jgi:DNA-3-methyladenine glycosylase I
MDKVRCAWVQDKELIYVNYHDYEWGIPIHDDGLLFEFLILEGMQAGLSWITVLKKRENFRKSFDYFNAEKIALYGDDKVMDLLSDKGIIRNKRKILSAIDNAKAYLRVKAEWGSFSEYIWSFVNGKPIMNHYECIEDVPAETETSRKMSKDLKKRGFKFVGARICYAFMQAVGMVNDHTTDCFRYKEIVDDYSS